MRVFIVAGESSGDLHAARLMRELRNLHPDVQFAGIGGTNMAAEGLDSLVPLDRLNVVGFAEIARNYPRLRRILSATCNSLLAWKPDVVVPVDFPGFNTRVASFARSHNIPVTWYIAPQLWAWGEGRASSFARGISELLVVFPFEEEFFRRFGITTHFVGHPLLDDPHFSTPPPPLGERSNTVAFLPGSRTQEIHRHMPLFRAVAEILRDREPSLRFGLARSRSIDPELLQGFNTDGLFAVHDDARALMKSARVGCIKTGTSTLEAALCGIPMCSIYKTSALTYRLGRYLVKLPSIALPNILARRPVIREFIQHDATPQNVSTEILRLLHDERADDGASGKDVRKGDGRQLHEIA
ncbi:MAG: lipid-A-disaccharide synthase, partial [Candidatus Kapaibacterium sp.]